MTRLLRFTGAMLALVVALGLGACTRSELQDLRVNYPWLFYILTGQGLSVYGLHNDGFITNPALGIYSANNLRQPAGVAVTSISSGHKYVVVSDPFDGFLDVYTYDFFGVLHYVGYIVDADGPYGLVYDDDYDDYFVVKRNTNDLGLYSVLNVAPYLQLSSRVAIPALAGLPAVVAMTNNVYIGGSGNPNFYGYGRGSNKTLTPLGTWSLGTQVSYVGKIGNSGYLMDIDNGGSGNTWQIEVWQDGNSGPTLKQQIALPGASAASCTSGTLGSIYCYFGISNGIGQYQFNSGQLTALSPFSIQTNSNYLQFINVGPPDTFLYTGDQNGNLTGYGIGSSGQLAPLNSTLGGVTFGITAKYAF